MARIGGPYKPVFEIRTQDGELLPIIDEPARIDIAPDSFMTATVTLVVEEARLTLTQVSDPGRPSAGTNTGASVPSTRSASCGGNGLPCASNAEPRSDSPGESVTGTENGSLKNASGLAKASIVAGSGEVLRSEKDLRDPQDKSSRGGVTAAAMASVPTAARCSACACSSAAFADASARCAAARVRSRNSWNFVSRCLASFSRAWASFLACLLPSSHPANEPSMAMTESPAVSHVAASNISSSVGGAGACASAGSGALEPTEEAPAPAPGREEKTTSSACGVGDEAVGEVPPSHGRSDSCRSCDGCGGVVLR